MDDQTVIVLGQARSGTSTVAGIIHELGVNMGNDFHPPTPSTPVGSFEDRAMTRMCLEIFQTAGGDYWYKPPSKERLTAVLENEMHDAYQGYISNRNKEGTWGVKAPWMNLMISTWAPHLRNMRIIVVERDRDAIISSSKRHVEHVYGNPLSDEKLEEAMTYFENSVNEFLADNPDVPVLRIRYEELIADPQDTVNSICEYLSLDRSASDRTRAIRIIRSKEEIGALRDKLTKESAFSLMDRIRGKISRMGRS